MSGRAWAHHRTGPPPGAFDVAPDADPTPAIARFASPLTRILLSSEGLTTTLLAALTAVRPRLRPVHQGRLPAAEAAPGAAELLRAGARTEVLTRHSLSLGHQDRALSVNHVVIRLDLLPRLAERLSVSALPLGAVLWAMGTGHRRTVLAAGHRAWPHDPEVGPGCFKTYVLWHDDEPLAAVTETFNPAVVPAATGE
ncbi:hypothetical protein [Streptomyces millisiae]|uniref:Chorismate lyase n=1 Tax=Streptomyces millisiae TaxID=3075542 RepID=A0ABU2LJ35_9ACTN|nr:hypothetical protein [Streptomyces sp. DSM 44918]MDT0317589.1 hypothetical protein [Streptomyces sp. DSM 44918]